MRPKQLKFFTKLQIEPDFPCLADDIVEPRPGMNIKVTAFTESKKLYYTRSVIRHCGCSIISRMHISLSQVANSDHYEVGGRLHKFFGQIGLDP